MCVGGIAIGLGMDWGGGGGGKVVLPVVPLVVVVVVVRGPWECGKKRVGNLKVLKTGG